MTAHARVGDVNGGPSSPVDGVPMTAAPHFSAEARPASPTPVSGYLRWHYYRHQPHESRKWRRLQRFHFFRPWAPGIGVVVFCREFSVSWAKADS